MMGVKSRQQEFALWRYQNCRFQIRGVCKMLKHKVSGSGTSVVFHCGECMSFERRVLE